MKKTVSVLMIFCILLSFCGCSIGEIKLELPKNGEPTDPPPVVTVVIGGEKPQCNGSSWWRWYRLNNGMTAELNASQVHPLALEYNPFRTFTGRADLQFSEPPTSFSVTAWPNPPEGQPRDDVESIQLTMNGHSFSLLEGDYIYEIHVSWEYKRKGAEGRYCFNAIYMPENL